MVAANKVVTTAVEGTSEAAELVKKEICNRILFISDRAELLCRQLSRENCGEIENVFDVFFLPSLMWGDIFHSALCEYMQPGCIFDGWQAGTGLEMQVQHNTEHLHLCSSGGKQVLKLKSQSKMEWHLSSVFNAGRPLHCDVDKCHPGSTTGD